MTLRKQVGMDAEVFDRLQFWEYLNLMEVDTLYFCYVSHIPTNITQTLCMCWLAVTLRTVSLSSLACVWLLFSS